VSQMPAALLPRTACERVRSKISFGGFVYKLTVVQKPPFFLYNENPRFYRWFQKAYSYEWK